MTKTTRHIPRPTVDAKPVAQQAMKVLVGVFVAATSLFVVTFVASLLMHTPGPVVRNDSLSDDPSPARISVPAPRPADPAEEASSQPVIHIHHVEKLRQLEFREEALRLIYDDIRRERESIDGQRRQVMEEMSRVVDHAAHQLTYAENQRDQIRDRERALDDRLTEVQKDEVSNLRKIVAVYESMKPETAAGILRQMVGEGNVDTAVKLLGQMKDRHVAKVLDALSAPDPALATQLTERLRGLRRP